MIPLSTRMRPDNLDDFVGQEHFLYKGEPAAEAGASDEKGADYSGLMVGRLSNKMPFHPTFDGTAFFMAEEIAVT